MNTLSFHDALSSAKLLLLLGSTSLFERNKEGQKLLSKLRAHIDVAVGALVLRDAADNAFDVKFEAYLGDMHKALFAAAGQLSVELLVTGTAPYNKLFKPGASNKTSTRTAARWVVDTLAPLADRKPGSDRSLEMTLMKVAQNKERAGLMKDFGSIVRNAEWMTLLVSLGVDLAEPSKMTALQGRLERAWGSRLGKDLLTTKTARFIAAPAAGTAAKRKPRTTGATKAAKAVHVSPELGDVAVITVTLDTTKLAHLPRTRELNVSDHDLSPRITDLLSAAAFPVRLAAGESAEAAAQAKLTAFLEGLEKRAVALDSARAKASKAAEDALKARALDALRKLGPLAQVLAANPELLKQV